MGDVWFPESRTRSVTETGTMMELPIGSWVSQGTLENGVMTRTKPLPEMETRAELVADLGRAISPDTAEQGVMRWGGETSVSLVHNVNLSNHIP